ncbi:PAS/PAC sensor signal transduction histidine kinase [Mariprofundus ferrinatatus]|uniref:histidine kinase n=1 Tax=Mariprofundus ferrinatatus TaxID=1921087 RepID=A0A2K8L5B2_9PROT|nr:ATP-binding protein [Mariprofundus ferrinatatus]ATX82500.1 PAS/PAC sensor signal transduction histidine kinase [Mariprofundus ferrinatatus]
MKPTGVMRLIPLMLAAALLTLTVVLWPASNGESVLLAWVNVSIMLILSLFLVQYGIKLIRERKAPPPGSRLRAKLVIALVGMLLVPAMMIQMAANQMVERGMDVWFDVRVDKLLDRALTLAQGFYERVEKDMKRSMLNYISDATLLAAASGKLDYRTVSTYLNEIRELEGWQKAELFDINELLIGGVQLGELTSLKATPLSDAARLSMRLGRLSTELITRGDGEVAVGYAPIVGPTTVIGLLRVEVRLPAGMIQNARAVEADYRSYRQLEHNRQNIGETFTHVMLFVTLLVVLIAGLVGLLFARRLTTPVGDLANALRRVTEGDLNVVISESSSDELGSLAHSFNTMANRLKLNVEAIEQAQQELTKALDNSRQRQYVLESLLANLHTGVLLVDGDGRVRLLNQAVRDILLLPDNWMPSVDILKASKGNLRDIGEFYAELSHQQEDHLQREFDIDLSEGRSLHVLARGARLAETGSTGFSGYLLVIDDISELAEAQRNKAWAEVARRLAHEIKNPLTPIKLSAERLQRRFRGQVDDEPVFDTCTHAIIAQVERLQRLIADFSTLARMPQPKVRQASVCSLLLEMLELFNTYDRLQVAECDMGWTCLCDPDQVRQVLINLVDNALTATDGVEGGAVRLYAATSEEFAEWHVEDDGEGVEASVASQLFEAYYSTKENGSGLGLAIAKRIAEDHGGSLILVSPAKPTHFCLRLPRHCEQMEES